MRSGSEASDLWVVSFLVMFFELTVIRWVPSTIHLVSYFSNIVLISCFLGLGIGCIMKDRKILFYLFPFSVLALLLLCNYGSQWFYYPFISSDAVFSATTETHQRLNVVPFVFVINATPFVCLGQKLGESFEGHSSLKAYSINVFSSLVGTIAFFGFSFLGTLPDYWFIVSFALAAWLLRGRRIFLIPGCLIMIYGLVDVHYLAGQFIWSPYYKIQLNRALPHHSGNLQLLVNDDYHQIALNLSDPWVRADRQMHAWRDTYDFPYRMLQSRLLDKVLVLGAGTGNDVAAALRNGSRHVDAVELDPTIYAIGKTRHPEHPYDDPRVQVYINDGRYFLRKQLGSYDAIVMGWLDSHRLFSSLSNVRQDNFVYTEESMRQVRSLLGDRGVLFLSFYIEYSWLGEKLYSMLTNAFGHPPLVFYYSDGAYGEQGKMFVIASNPAVTLPANVPGFVNCTTMFERTTEYPAPTDDWPYLYYKTRSLSWEYLSVLSVLFALSAVAVWLAVPKGKVHYREAVHFLFLGAGFLLLETKNIVGLALTFGSTWMVTSIVISCILAMILLANYLVGQGLVGERLWEVWALLFGSVLLGFVCRDSNLPISSPGMRAVVLTLITSSSFLFAGVIFARSFSRTTNPGLYLGFNVLGAVLGGFTEYLSLVMGISGLCWIALAFYAVAFASVVRVKGAITS